MPIYEFECEKCGHRFEIMQGVSEPAPKKCPDCNKGPLRKIFHPAGIIFKGSGFYATDYAKKDSEAKARKEKEPGKEKEAAGTKEGEAGRVKSEADSKGDATGNSGDHSGSGAKDAPGDKAST